MNEFRNQVFDIGRIGGSSWIITSQSHSKNSPKLWFWSFGDGKFSAQQNPVHRYERAGKYNVILTVKNAGGFDTKVVRDYINVNRK